MWFFMTCVFYQAPGSSVEEKEQFILDLLHRAQPYQDHCYTSVFGKRFVDRESEGEETESDDDLSLNSQGGRVGHFANTYHGHTGLPGAPPNNMPVDQEVVVQEMDPHEEGRSGKKGKLAS
jgi:hypothetical protein